MPGSYSRGGANHGDSPSSHPSKAVRITNMRVAALCALSLVALNAWPQNPKAPFTVDAMLRLKRIGDPQLSPDGKTVAFTVQTIDLADNSKPTQIYTVPVDGGAPQQITHEGKANTRPRWTPDSRHIFFVSDRAGGSQIWSMDSDGSNARQITNMPTDAEGETLSPDGHLILFTSAVYPDCAAAGAKPGVLYDGGCNKSKLDAEATSKMKARVFDSLLYRHWTNYEGARRQHLLVQASDGSSGGARSHTRPARGTAVFAWGAGSVRIFAGQHTDYLRCEHG